MEQEKENYLTLTAIIILSLVVIISIWFFFFRPDNSVSVTGENDTFQTVPRLGPEQPRNLIVGYVIDIGNLGAGEIAVSLDLEEIFINATQPRLERVIKLTPDTKYSIYDDITNEKVRETTIDEIEIWSGVVVATVERAVEVFDREFFTAREIRIMVHGDN